MNDEMEQKRTRLSARGLNSATKMHNKKEASVDVVSGM